MSFAAKTTFTLCCAVSIGTIVYVHYSQEAQRKQLHLGVERDIQRQEQRKIQNLYMLEQQKLLTKELREANRIESNQSPA